MDRTTIIVIIIAIIGVLYAIKGRAQDYEAGVPAGYRLEEVVIGDATVQYLVSDEIELSAEELAEIAPAAGNIEPGPFIGPAAPQNYNEAWVTEDLE